MMRGGFTLFEMLAVIVIMSLVAAALTVSLAAADDQAASLNAMSQCRDLDARARQAALTQGEPAVIRLVDEQGALILEVGAARLAHAEMPPGVKVHLQRDRAVGEIVFDRAGRSPDYRVTLQQDDRLRVRGWRVCGLTGFIIEDPNS
jgi:prepilin-type N-terminal cleavage/methylation domain-containing protein